MAVGRTNTTDQNRVSGHMAAGLAENLEKMNKKEWLVEWVLPGLFVLILVGCLVNLGYYAVQGSLLPAAGFQYATSAFAS